MRPENIKTVSKIVMDLIVRNMKAGASYEKAKEMAFNRMNKEYPKVLAVWVEEAFKKEEHYESL